METKKKNRSMYHWVILVCCILTLVFNYATRFSLAQLFTVEVLNETGFPISALMLGTTIASGVCIFTSPIAGKLLRGKYMRITFFICCVGTMGFYSCYGLCHELWQFWLVGGLQGFFAMGACTLPVNVLITNWFEKNRALMISIATMGISIGGTVLGPFITFCIQNYGWRNAYFMLGALCLIFMIPISGFIIRRTPEEVGLEPYGHGEEAAPGKKKSNAVVQSSWNVSLKDARKSPIFWMFILGAFTLYLTSCILGHMSYYLYGEGFDAATVTAYISLYSIVALFAKLILGAIFDRFGAKAGVTVGLGTFFLFFVCLYLVRGSQFFLYSASVLYGIGTCTITIGVPIMITSIFGVKHYSELYGFTCSFTMAASAFGPSAIGLVYDLTGSYKPAILTLAALTVLTLVIMITCINMGQKRAASDTPEANGAQAAKA
ncbi:MAG: MFS transporter [Eubacteriales bacterium]|nr:MFS transporter [Eubacteriales bacterium]